MSYEPPPAPPPTPGWQEPIGYGQNPPAAPPGYAPGPYPGSPQGYRQDHPRANTALVLGILGIVLCQLISPFAMSMGRKAMREIDASGGALGGRGSAQAGWILGLIGTILIGVTLLFVAVFVVIGIVAGSNTDSMGLLHQA
jgi:hypothetical protein